MKRLHALLVSVVVVGSAHAQVFNKKTWNTISVNGITYFEMAAILSPLIRDGKPGLDRSLRAGDALLCSLIADRIIKGVIFETRPNKKGRDSFPSGTASAAFSVAAVISHYRPDEAPLWYAGAGVLAASRLVLKKHYLHDVIAGVGIGFGLGRLSVTERNGLFFRPMFLPRTGPGVMATFKF